MGVLFHYRVSIPAGTCEELARLHQQTCGRDTCSRLELGLASLEASKCEATSCQDTAIGLANLAAVLDSVYEQVRCDWSTRARL